MTACGVAKVHPRYAGELRFEKQPANPQIAQILKIAQMALSIQDRCVLENLLNLRDLRIDRTTGAPGSRVRVEIDARTP